MVKTKRGRAGCLSGICAKLHYLACGEYVRKIVEFIGIQPQGGTIGARLLQREASKATKRLKVNRLHRAPEENDPPLCNQISQLDFQCFCQHLFHHRKIFSFLNIFLGGLRKPDYKVRVSIAVRIISRDGNEIQKGCRAIKFTPTS